MEMTIEQEMCHAIQARQHIFYTYSRENRVVGEREGDPHIVFEGKSGHLMVHIWKTGGVQTDPSKEIPDWRYYYLSDVVIVRSGDSFTPQDSFNPQYERYAAKICSV